MRRYKTSTLVLTFASWIACGASAEERPEAQAETDLQPAAAAPASKAKPAAPGSTIVEGVTVQGAAPQGFRGDIDRRSYGVAGDLAAANGSISDVLKTIPSVDVDVRGVVTLRGDSNVTIMIDGKPSGLFAGASGAQALQSMPADQIERVEVITNPSAQFSPDGGAGIINLITKQNHKPGESGSIRANLGSAGHRNVSVSGGYNARDLSISVDAGARHDPQRGVDTIARTFLDGHGDTLGTEHALDTDRRTVEQRNAKASVDYDATSATRLSAVVRYNHMGVAEDSVQQVEADDPAGVPTAVFVQPSRFRQDRDIAAVEASIRHKFSGDDHELVMSVSRERTDDDHARSFNPMFSLPAAAPDAFTELRGADTLTLTEVKADYTRPMPDGGKLKTGYDLKIDDNRYDDTGLLGTSMADARPDPAQTDLFLYKQTIKAAYVTYEQPFGDWTVQAGLRLEDVQLDLNQATSNLTHDTNRFDAYPSLHLAYRVSEAQQLLFSYSRRVQRPDPQDLNPFRVQNDALNFEAGNPNLKPQQTQSFEAGYQYKSGTTLYLATLYYRQNEHGTTFVVSDLGGGAVLRTQANLSDSQNAGLELVANGHLTKTLTYNLSSNLYWTEIDTADAGPGVLLGFARRRSAFEAGGRGSFTWQATPKDQLQLSGLLIAKRLTPQGYIAPSFSTLLGYRHTFNNSLSAVVTVTDLLDTIRYRQVIDTPLVSDRLGSHWRTRAAYVGLNWSFGSGTKRPPDTGFDASR